MILKKGLNNKAQTWSVDLIVGVVVFLLLVVILYAVLSGNSTNENNLRIESDQVLSSISLENSQNSGLPAIIDQEQLNNDSLNQLYSNSSQYLNIKEKLGIKGEVCILLVDDTGGIVQINGQSSFGNRTHNIAIGAGVYCGD